MFNKIEAKSSFDRHVGWQEYALLIRKVLDNIDLRDGPLENLWGGGAAKYKKIKLKKFISDN